MDFASDNPINHWEQNKQERQEMAAHSLFKRNLRNNTGTNNKCTLDQSFS